jgi:predicted MFS family arabinose efflux permease
LISDGDTNTDDQFLKTNLAMTAFGFGEIFGCLFIGYIVDKFGTKKAGFVILIIISIMTAFTLGVIAQYKYDFLVFAMTFAWGF